MIRTGRSHRRPALGLLGAALLVGCGGDGGGGTIFDVTPKTATVAPGESTIIHVTAVEIPVQSYSFAVVEGPSGGTVVENADNGYGSALYTAPATKGTYHVRAGILQGPGSSRLRTVTIVVR